MSHFFAYLSRMKLINRWSLMRSTLPENVQEHSLQVAMVAHCLAVVKNKFYEGNVDPSRVALLAIFHDASEVVTGDLPTPVKYFNSEIKQAYKTIEEQAINKIVEMLPTDLRSEYHGILQPSEEEKEHEQIVKSADTLCAFIKCLEEEAAGNQEFTRARKTIEQKLTESKAPEVSYFIEHFISSFSLTLDELNSPI